MKAGAPSHQPTHEALLRLAIAMRGAQRAYFRTRARCDLELAKQTEQAFDKAVTNFADLLP